MRVISGQAKGHKLVAPEGFSTRPTTDKIKESLFNILAPEIAECEFLDLFSGSGSIGIEALSRGAARAVFVDSSSVCQKVIERNLKFTKLDKYAKIIKKDIYTALKYLGELGHKFDIIFMDPPYEKNFNEPVLEAIYQAGILKKEGFIIVEHATKIPLKPMKEFQIMREKDYKTTTMTFLVLEE